VTGTAKENKFKVKQNQFLPLVMLQLAALMQLLMSSPQLSILWTNNFYKIMYVFIPVQLPLQGVSLNGSVHDLEL